MVVRNECRRRVERAGTGGTLKGERSKARDAGETGNEDPTRLRKKRTGERQGENGMIKRVREMG